LIDLRYQRKPLSSHARAMAQQKHEPRWTGNDNTPLTTCLPACSSKESDNGTSHPRLSRRTPYLCPLSRSKLIPQDFASDNPSDRYHLRPRPKPARCSSLASDPRSGLALPTGKCCTIMAYSSLHSRSGRVGVLQVERQSDIHIVLLSMFLHFCPDGAETVT
jgi:hypothetical protein